MPIDCAGDTRHRNRRRRVARRGVAAIVVASAGLAGSAAMAQSIVTACTSACAPVDASSANTAVSSAFAQFDLGSRFLHFLGDQGGVNWQGTPNAGGGGADAPAAAPVYRSWAEGYGLRTTTAAQTNFAGDTRSSLGGVAGIGMKVAPGAMIGLSVDQSHTKIDVANLPQTAKLDLTQIGLNGVYETGPWAFSGAGVYGFANVSSSRDTGLGTASAAYNAHLFGAIAEASYYRGFGASRVVPKFGLDWMRTETAAFSEVGGFGPVSAPTQVAMRARAFVGAEVGHTWTMEQRMFDLSAYGRVVDIFARQVPTLLLTSSSPFFTPQTVQGAVESRLGFDTGLMASYRFAANARLYAGYDGRFRDGYQAHGGTLGVEVRW